MVFHAGSIGLVETWVNFPLLTGASAVNLFFVLSGFLITHLLLKEYDQNERINLKAFYIRRTLRIWPLYYLVLLVTALAFSGLRAIETKDWIGGLLFAGNVTFFTSAILPPFNQLWTIGVEEQFYLIWPWLLRRSIRRAVVLLIGIIVLRYMLIFASDRLGLETLYWLLLYNKFDLLAVGALAAFVLRTSRVNWIYRLEWLWWPLVLLPMLWPFEITTNPYVNTLEGCIFAGIILCVATKPRPIIRLPQCQFLGNLSYGIYIWQGFVVQLIRPYTYMADSYLPRLGLMLALTFPLAWLSYRYLETPILRLRDQFKTEQAATISLETNVTVKPL